MIPEENLQNNVDRFNGFADDYDQHRPEAPSLVVEIITRYLERKVELVVRYWLWNRAFDFHLERRGPANCRHRTQPGHERKSAA